MLHKFKELLIGEKTTVRSAMRKIQETSRRALFVVDNNNRLRGAINDGDIRRWILNKGNLDSSVRNVYNKHPVSVKVGYSRDHAKQLILRHWIECLPVLNDKHQIVDIIFISDVFGKKSQRPAKKINVPVVIMAGGKGKRLDPFTRVLPKPLIPVGEKPIIELIVEQFKRFGCRRFYFILNYRGTMVKSYFDNTALAGNIKYIFENKPNGTCGGLRFLPKEIAGDIFVSNCDMLIKADYADILNFHRKNNSDITVIGSMRRFKVPYGVLGLKEGKLSDIVEKPAYDHLINTGMYLIKKKMISLLPKGNMPIHFPQLIKEAIRNKKKIMVYPVSERAWLDVGQWEEYWKNIKHLHIGGF